MEPDFEELDDILDAHMAVLFIREQDTVAQMGLQILEFIGLPPHIVDLTGQPNLEQMVRANMADLDLPAIFLNGVYFSDVFVLMDIIEAGELAKYLNRLSVPYDADALAALEAANQN